MSRDVDMNELAAAIRALPPDKIAEVRDFILFLHERYGNARTSIADEWSDDDLRDVVACCCDYANSTIPWDECDSANETPQNERRESHG